MKKIVLYTASVCLLTACAHNHPQDPLEPINRVTFKFNQAVDDVLVTPVVRVYRAIVPWPLRQGVSNFFNNIDDVATSANYLLQGNPKKSLTAVMRVVVNSTLGIGGLFNLATDMGLDAPHQDLGMTFAKWGDKESAYIVLPFFGPSSIRDAAGFTFDYALLSPYAYLPSRTLQYSLYGGLYLDTRSEFFDAQDISKKASLDRYAFERDAFLQHRRARMNPDAAVEDDYVEEESAVEQRGTQ